MANLRLAHLILYDKMPGAVNPNKSIPTDGWDNTVDNFVTSDDTALAFNPPVPIGEKRMAYQDGTLAPGWYTCQYLAYHSQCSATAAISGDYSDGVQWCSKSADTSQSMHSDTSVAPWFLMAKCVSDIWADQTKGFGLALPCATLTADGSTSATNGYGDAYGWFWVGGVCPFRDVTLFTDSTTSADASTGHGVDVTVGAIAQSGPVFMDATLLLVSADMSNAADATAVQVGVDVASLAQGYACASAG